MGEIFCEGDCCKFHSGYLWTCGVVVIGAFSGVNFNVVFAYGVETHAVDPSVTFREHLR